MPKARPKKQKAPTTAKLKKAEKVLVDRALAKALSPSEIRSVLETEGFDQPVIEYVLSRTMQVMKKYTAAPGKRTTDR